MKKTNTNTRQLLLEATLKLISEKGYLGATTREIAQEAGVTELTLFRNFGSKELLFEELLKSRTFLPQLKELLPELDGLSVDDALATIAERFLLSLKDRKAMIKIMHSEVTIYPEKIRDVYNKFIEAIRTTLGSYFDSLQQRNILRKDVSPETAAKVFLWIFISYFRAEEIMRSGGMKKNIMGKHIREFIDIFSHGTLNNSP